MICISSLSRAEDKKPRDQLMKIIDEELREIDRILRQSKKFNSELQFRKAETVLEKGRLVKESENEDFLNIDPKYRGRVNKKKFFRQSYRYYLWAKNLAVNVSKKDPNYKRTPELNYILGFYEKEFGKEKNALEFFKKAEATSKPATEFNLRCKSAIAEILYNQKNYEEAKKYYEVTLKRINDKWWTKDSHSLAWCYHKTGQYDQAIATMKKVIEKSKTGEYVDMQFIAYKDIGLFFAESSQADDGVKYFKNQNKDVVAEMLTIAAFLREKGSYQHTLDVYNEAYQSTNNNKLKARILLEKLVLADKFFKKEQHLSDSKLLINLWKEGALDPEQEKSYILQMKKQVALVQKRMDTKYKSQSGTELKEKANVAETYFQLLSIVDEKNSDEYQFYNAESQFQTMQYERAAELYKKSFDDAKKNNNLKLMKLSAEGLLAALGPDSGEFKERNQYFEQAYKNYLEVDKESNKSEDIYRRLYKLMYQQGDTEGMRSILQDYSKSFSQNTNEQDKMVASLLSVYDKKKQNDKIAELVDEVQAGRFFVSEKLKGDIYGVKQKIELKEAETSIASGDVKSAFKNYDKIYKDPKSSKLAKANAVYNLMVLSYRMNDLSPTYNYGVESLELMGNQAIVGYLPSFVSISKYLFERMQFQASADFAHRVLAKVCSASQVQYKKMLFNNAVLSYRAAEQNKKLVSLIEMGHDCKLSDDLLIAAEIEYLDSLREKKGWSELLRRLEKNNSVLPTSFSGIELEYFLDMCISQDDSKSCSQLNKNVNSVISSGTKISGRALDAVALVKSNVIWEKIYTWSQIKLRFPEKTFNELLSKKLKTLEQIVEELLALQKMGSRLGINHSYELLSFCYFQIAREIQNFTPTGVSKEYLDSFKASMGQISSTLYQKLNEYRGQAMDVMSKQESIAPLRGIFPIAIPLEQKSSLKFNYNEGEM